MRDGGCYGHVDGPRFNTARRDPRARRLRRHRRLPDRAARRRSCAARPSCPYALLGFLTDYANGVKDEATPVDTLVEMMAASADAFAAVLCAALPRAREPIVRRRRARGIGS